MERVKKLKRLDLEACGNNYYGAWSVPEIFILWSSNSLPAEPPGKPKNTCVGNLSLLQQIFPTQESNQGLLHCRRILYQVSYQGSPKRQPLGHHLA